MSLRVVCNKKHHCDVLFVVIKKETWCLSSPRYFCKEHSLILYSKMSFDIFHYRTKKSQVEIKCLSIWGLFMYDLLYVNTWGNNLYKNRIPYLLIDPKCVNWLYVKHYIAYEKGDKKKIILFLGILDHVYNMVAVIYSRNFLDYYRLWIETC